MKHHYSDIRSLITQAPIWFDEHGVPRYCAFAPNEGANIYASEIALLRIRCQSCARGFNVCMSWDMADRILRKAPPLADRIRDGSIHYGDPPNVECCPAGPTMNSEPVRVIEFWRREGFDPVRVHELEVHLDEDDGE